MNMYFIKIFQNWWKLSLFNRNLFLVYNAGVLGPKGLAKKLAKDTGKVAVGVPEQVIRGNVKLEPSKEPPLMPSSDNAVTYLPSSTKQSSTPATNDIKDDTKENKNHDDKS